MQKQIWLSILAINYVYSSDPTPTSAAAARFSEEDIKTYEAIQKILDLTPQHTPVPKFSPYDGQVKQGLYLYTTAGEDSEPSGLLTPWGRLEVWGELYRKEGLFYELSALLKLEFVRNEAEEAMGRSCRYERYFIHYDKEPFLFHDDFHDFYGYPYRSRRRTKESGLKLWSFRGKPFKVSSLSHSSIYKIVEVDGVVLPEPQEFSRGEGRNSDVCRDKFEDLKTFMSSK